MLLDQTGEKKKTISGNNQLLKGAVFAAISLSWFCFLFAFINMDWDRFSPLTPVFFTHDRQKEDYIFYFICFSFFITTLIFSTIFYRDNLQPTDLLLRFGTILVVFVLLYFLHEFFRVAFFTHKQIVLSSLHVLPKGTLLLSIANVVLTFIFLYLIFYPLILFFSKVFFNGFFGLAGFMLCFFITVVFYLALYGLSGLEEKMGRTPYPVSDVAAIIFFTLLAFGVGVASGNEEKKKRTVRSGMTGRLKRTKF